MLLKYLSQFPETDKVLYMQLLNEYNLHTVVGRTKRAKVFWVTQPLDGYFFYK